jgi:membrane protease YdiL (CAAX protease family)
MDPLHSTINHSSSVVSVPPPLPTPEKRVSKLRWWIHLLIMASLPIVAGTAGAAAHGKGPALGHSALALLKISAFELLFFGIFFAAAWVFSRASKDELLLRWRPGPLVLPLGLIYSVAIRVITGIVTAFVTVIVMASTHATTAQVQSFAEAHRPKVETLIDVEAMSRNPAYFWLNVILVSFLVGGLREEIWRSSFIAGLRALWPRAFDSESGGILAAGIAALFFGVGHLPQGWMTAAMIAVVGFLLGVIMTLHRSIWPSVIAHGFFDAASMALLSLLPWLTHLPA